MLLMLKPLRMLLMPLLLHKPKLRALPQVVVLVTAHLPVVVAIVLPLVVVVVTALLPVAALPLHLLPVVVLLLHLLMVVVTLLGPVPSMALLLPNIGMVILVSLKVISIFNRISGFFSCLSGLEPTV